MSDQSTPTLLAMPIREMAAMFVTAKDPWNIDGEILARLARFVLDAPPDEDVTRKAERERLAAWIEEHANDLRSLAPDGLQIESIAFLLRLAGE